MAGAGIASLSVLLDPACVVIGGGVIDAGEILLKPTVKHLNARCLLLESTHTLNLLLHS
jgi:predicted NBD/HSP70 family sugar kinase